MIRHIRIPVLLGAIALVGATACGGESSGDTSTGSGGSSDGTTVSITEPADGSSIQVPFTLSVNSSVPLGPTESGNHHVHLFFDGDDSKYEVIEASSVEVSPDSPAVAGLSPGKHDMNISLRNADHSPAGVETKVTVDVGGTGGGQPAPPGGGDGGGYY